MQGLNVKNQAKETIILELNGDKVVAKAMTAEVNSTLSQGK